mmetsp:Transcript_34729/g.92088  ORF Transcript_34729/g.92088 Transcript_34729/m.92088 type:complete len:211 (-) Transcript_34729:987-1619(-)
MVAAVPAVGAAGRRRRARRPGVLGLPRRGRGGLGELGRQLVSPLVEQGGELWGAGVEGNLHLLPRRGRAEPPLVLLAQGGRGVRAGLLGEHLRQPLQDGGRCLRVVWDRPGGEREGGPKTAGGSLGDGGGRQRCGRRHLQSWLGRAQRYGRRDLQSWLGQACRDHGGRGACRSLRDRRARRSLCGRRARRSLGGRRGGRSCGHGGRRRGS